mmetsp:Transcript_49996/g.134527  ORF Transcript_49996/g.134527 Transcript_49996/m.134527 type:complete len:283 (+) Transcript_49996:888-1736(+)
MASRSAGARPCSLRSDSMPGNSSSSHAAQAISRRCAKSFTATAVRMACRRSSSRIGRLATVGLTSGDRPSAHGTARLSLAASASTCARLLSAPSLLAAHSWSPRRAPSSRSPIAACLSASAAAASRCSEAAWVAFAAPARASCTPSSFSRTRRLSPAYSCSMLPCAAATLAPGLRRTSCSRASAPSSPTSAALARYSLPLASRCASSAFPSPDSLAARPSSRSCSDSWRRSCPRAASSRRRQSASCASRAAPSFSSRPAASAAAGPPRGTAPARARQGVGMP